MIPLFINIKSRIAHPNAYDKTPLHSIDLRAGDTPVLNLYFMLPTRDQRAPYAITRFASAAVVAQLLDAGKSVIASQNVFTEIVPATTAPAVTHNQAPSTTRGLFDTITLASEPGSGSLVLKLSGGTITVGNTGAGSASARVYPGGSQEAEVVSAFAAMIGAPYKISFGGAGAQGGPTIIDVHGNAIPSGTGPTVTSVDVSGLQYLFGWGAQLDLTGAGVSAIADLQGDTPQVWLAIKLTPSGGAAETVLQIPVNLSL